jgi:WD40 repeat protein
MTTVFSAADDYTIRVWDVASQECRAVWQAHSYRIVSLKYYTNRAILASASLDGTIKLWDIQTGTCTRTIHYPGPYDGMNITGTTGLTDAQRETLRTLGAVE